MIRMKTAFLKNFFSPQKWVCGLGLLLGGLPGMVDLRAATVCATVKMEISQELTLERQGFEATMTINNTLPDTLTDVQVTLQFQDELKQPVSFSFDSANSSALFFVRADGTHPTSIAPNSSPKLLWTLIPARGAAAGNPKGTLYFVGAQLRYKNGPDQETIDIAPDYIHVKPLPDLRVDYFIPSEVFGDDPITPIAEPVVPFAMGVRLINEGFGVANALRIDTGEPRIVRNDLGVPIQFKILGSEVNGQASQPVLLLNFGSLGPQDRAIGRWEMATTLSGSFISFSANYSHSNELGGELTSLLQTPVTHLILRDVLVDIPGRDSIHDFLAMDVNTMRVYESDPGTQDVEILADNRFESETLQSYGNMTFRVETGSVTPTSFFYIQAPDPYGGDKVISRVVRSDGKNISLSNAWLTKKRNGQSWNYYFRLFDFNGGTVAKPFSYLVYFDEVSSFNRAPVLGALADRIISVGTPIQILVKASDPDGTVPVLTLDSRPYGSTFTPNLDGTAFFQWTPTASGPVQIGSFPLVFSASDGKLTDKRTVMISVSATGSLLDDWKEKYWPGQNNNPNVTGNSADPDFDDMPNLLEYALGLDPTRSSYHLKPQIGKVEIAGKHYLTLTYVGRTDDPALIFEAIATGSYRSADDQWQVQQTAVETNQEDVASGFLRVKMRDSVALEDSASGRFIRLRVRLSP